MPDTFNLSLLLPVLADDDKARAHVVKALRALATKYEAGGNLNYRCSDAERGVYARSTVTKDRR